MLIKQVFLQNTGNIYQQQAQRSVPNLLPIGKEEVKEESEPKDVTPDEEPPTPTNVQPPEIEAVHQVQEEKESKSSDEEEDEDDEDSSTDDQNAEEEESETESSNVPFEAQNEIVELPSVAVVEEVKEQEAVPVIDLGEAPGESADFDEPPKPQLAVQEDFDLSPCSEQVDNPPVTGQVPRSKSRESVDSGKLGLTETELSDWADSSLAGELDLDTEPVKLAKETRPELPKSNPPALSNGPSTQSTQSAQLDDIEFADDGDELSEVKDKPEKDEEAPVPVKTLDKTPVKTQVSDFVQEFESTVRNSCVFR